MKAKLMVNKSWFKAKEILFLFLLITSTFFLVTNLNSEFSPQSSEQIEKRTSEPSLSNIKQSESNSKVNSQVASLKLISGENRTGDTFSSAINMFENTSIHGILGNTGQFHYYRYYSRFPYQYPSINLESNDSQIDMYLLDQFNSTILYSTGLGFNKLLELKSSDNLNLKEKIRFIGWYYIKVVATNAFSKYNITYTFIRGDGSSLWSSIQIGPNKGNNPAWDDIFYSRENSEARNSLFFSFYVNSSAPEVSISLTVDGVPNTMLYDPDFTFLRTYYKTIDWLASKEGFYYIEVYGNLDGKSLKIDLHLNSNSVNIGGSYDNPLIIDRNVGLTDSITGIFFYRKMTLKI